MTDKRQRRTGQQRFTYQWYRPRSRSWKTAPGCRTCGSKPPAALGVQSHQSYGAAMGNQCDRMARGLIRTWRVLPRWVDGDSKDVYHSTQQVCVCVCAHLAGVAIQPCITQEALCSQTPPELQAWALCPTVHLLAPPHVLSPHLAPRCLQSPGGRRVGHTGKVVRCSAWAPSAPWAAGEKAGLMLGSNGQHLFLSLCPHGGAAYLLVSG